MVAPIQGNSYQPGAQMGYSDKVSQAQMTNPGLYSLDQAVMADLGIKPPKEEHSIFHSLGKLVLEGAALTAVAVGLRKGVFHDLKGIDAVGKDGVHTLTKPAEDAKLIDKAKYYYAKSTDWVYDNTIEKLMAHFKKGGEGEATGTTGEGAAAGNGVDTKA
ncbi:hypothetical protein KBA27_05905 [bacterium]|nr:hypothetical protein [bacterium]